MATWILATARTRLGAAITTTAVGFLVSLLFVVYRSPDILLTQILIETVSTIFFLLVVYFMPPFKKEHPSPPRKLVNLGISAAVGVTITVLLLLCMSPPYRELHNLGAGYLSRSLAEGGGANAVNVIIVDIRAMDTNGEITVLVVVGLCVYGLLRARRRAA
jgi:multicomponent Na+:H+ antiporter subunit A